MVDPTEPSTKPIWNHRVRRGSASQIVGHNWNPFGKHSVGALQSIGPQCFLSSVASSVVLERAAAVRNAKAEKCKRRFSQFRILLLFTISRELEYKHGINCNIGKICTYKRRINYENAEGADKLNTRLAINHKVNWASPRDRVDHVCSPVFKGEKNSRK